MAKKQTKKKESQGLGDTVEKILDVTGIGAVAKFILGEDCKCDERKEKLNKLYPYNKPLCLLEEEYEWLKEFFAVNRASISPSQQQAILPIYNRVMRNNKKPSNCADCWREIVRELKNVFETYKEEQ